MNRRAGLLALAAVTGTLLLALVLPLPAQSGRRRNPSGHAATPADGLVVTTHGSE